MQVQEQRSTQPESIVNDETRTFADADWPIGSTAGQGDLILVRIRSMPMSAKPRINRQVADGNTHGSRHVLTAGSVFDCDQQEVATAIKSVCPRMDADPRYIGPVFATVNGNAMLEHPEHGDHCYSGDMIVAVVFQRSLDAEEREQRVQD